MAFGLRCANANNLLTLAKRPRYANNILTLNLITFNLLTFNLLTFNLLTFC
ncbi:MAG: hypothetical protein F6K56_24680 [Moorea sp. SIO3G5]|nr:hypothetical protein [Moorena sp. SIO3G5]